MTPPTIQRGRRLARRTVALATVAVTLSACGAWRGAAGVWVPGGPGSGSNHITIFAQMPDTLALNVNSPVRVADVNVGSVRAITVDDWVATVTLDIEPTVKLPKNATAKIGQTSLLGSQHIELAAPADPSPQRLTSGDTIPLAHTSAFPTTERVLASIATILRGGNIPSLDVITDEANNLLTGRSDQIREFLTRLDTFTNQLNQQRDQLVHAIDASNRLFAIVAANNTTLDRLLTELPSLAKHFADTRVRFTDAVLAVGHISKAADDALSPLQADLHTDLQLLQRPLSQISCAAPYLIEALKVLPTYPFNVDAVPKLFRGDYINAAVTLDLTLSTVDNGLFTGTGISGMLRALEQSWGRSPDTMLPDIRFTPNPHDAPGGPLVERSTTC